MNSRDRMAVHYSLVFAGTGVSLPFIGLWLGEHGLTGAEIGVLLAAPMLGRLATGPGVALWADGFRYRRTPIAILALVSAIAFGAMGVVEGFAAWLLLWFVGATALGNVIPLSDVLTLKRARREGFVYAVPRGMGSIAFIVANVVMGAILTRAGVDAILVWITIAAFLAGAAANWLIPDEPVHEKGERSRGRDRLAGLGRLVTDPTFMTVIVAAGLIQATHAFYYGFSALLWKAHGVPESVTGLLWATAVAAEIVFLWFLEPWRRRVGPWALLMIGGGVAVLRWIALALAPPLWLLWPLQLLHAFSFAATFLGGLMLVERHSPPQSASAAQTLSSALSSGVLIGLATAFSGPLYDRYGEGGYWAMALLAAGGVLLALRLRPPRASPAP